jgi:hypothetical protein
MRSVLSIVLLGCSFAATTRAQDVVFLPPVPQPPSSQPPNPQPPGPQPVVPQGPEPPVPMMVPPVPPLGVVPVPRGDLGAPNPLEQRLSNPFAQATEAGGQAARTFNENFDGDFAGVYYRRLITTGFTTQTSVVGATQTVTGFTPVTTTTTTTVNNGRVTTVTNTITTTNNSIIATTPVTVTNTVAQQRLVDLTLAARYSGVLITDNDNPRPQDRVYGGFNYYQNVGGSLNPDLGSTDLQREMVGFEKTFFNGNASFGMRLPFVQQYGPSGVGGTHNVGDLTLIWKYAFINNRESGDLWSAGLVLTTPTGSGDAILFDGSKAPHSVLFQPWSGFVRTFDRAYLQGITSFVFPTDHRDPALWNNSLGAGYYLYRNADGRWLTAIVPVAEIHIRTPLNDRNPLGPVYLQNQANFTGGIHFRFGRLEWSTAVDAPLAGPRPWAYEVMSFVNFYF